MNDEIVGGLVCVAMPPDTRITGVDDQLRIALRASTIVRIGGRSTANVVVRGPNIARSQASLVIIQIDEAGCCSVRDSGHNFLVRVNDQVVSTPRALVDGDVIEACLFDEPLGLRFRFESTLDE